MPRIEKQYRQSVADVDTENWPVYIVFKNNNVMLISPGQNITLKDDQVKAHGCVDRLKWLCYDAETAKIDTKSSEILRLFLRI